jgi:hypothetical protein
MFSDFPPFLSRPKLSAPSSSDVRPSKASDGCPRRWR